VAEKANLLFLKVKKNVFTRTYNPDSTGNCLFLQPRLKTYSNRIAVIHTYFTYCYSILNWGRASNATIQPLINLYIK